MQKSFPFSRVALSLFLAALALALGFPRPPAMAATPAPAVLSPLPQPAPYTVRWRVGVGVAHRNPLLFQWPAARPGWFHNWDFDIHTLAGGYNTPRPRFVLTGTEAALGMAYVPLVRTLDGRHFQSAALLGELATAYPGLAWMIGNEPDNAAQDWATPAQYAEVYHHAYFAIKQADPTAQVIAGNLSQITPLRLRYLDAVWAAYRKAYATEMPVDVWGMHAFVLREQAGAWGAGIPPGLEDAAGQAPTQGMLWEVDDHDNLALVAGQVRRMRTWMASHGQRARPLWITEYGILMPADYGFPPARVARFLTGSFDLLRTLRDARLGMPGDGNLMVQRWVWFSTYAPEYPTGDLFTAEGRPTYLMATMADYLARYGGIGR